MDGILRWCSILRTSSEIDFIDDDSDVHIEIPELNPTIYLSVYMYYSHLGFLQLTMPVFRLKTHPEEKDEHWLAVQRSKVMEKPNHYLQTK